MPFTMGSSEESWVQGEKVGGSVHTEGDGEKAKKGACRERTLNPLLLCFALGRLEGVLELSIQIDVKELLHYI